MRECRTYGSVRGVPGDRHPYRNSLDRHIFACIHRGGCMDPRTFWSASILACHSHIDACFIHKDTIVSMMLVHCFLLGLALTLDIAHITLFRVLCLFFRVSCN
jgi:hypothetical protein